MSFGDNLKGMIRVLGSCGFCVSVSIRAYVIECISVNAFAFYFYVIDLKKMLASDLFMCQFIIIVMVVATIATTYCYYYVYLYIIQSK